MSYKTWRAQQLLGAFFVWLTHPYTLITGAVCIGLGVLTWQFFDEPIFGFTVREFVTRTIPSAINWFLVLAAKTAAKRPVVKLIFLASGILILKWVLDVAKEHFKDELVWWETCPLWKKGVYVAVAIAGLWLLVGWWAFFLFPISVARDLVVFGAGWVISYFSLYPLIEKMEERISALVPEKLKELWCRLEVSVEQWAKHHRDILHSHERIRALKQRARELLYRKKQKKEAQKRAVHTEHFRERFKKPPFTWTR